MSTQAKTTWRKVKFGEILSVSGGGTPSTSNPKYWNGEIPWLTPAEVTNLDSRFINTTGRKISKEGLKNSSAKLMPAGSILLTSRATIGDAVINRVPMATNQGFINIPPSEKVDQLFLFYWLKRNRAYLNQIAIGSTFPELIKSVFKELEAELPSLEYQKRIADILSAFDDKIELNNKISRTLEEMAQSIFKEWFVKFRFPGHEKVEFVDSELGKIPKEWDVRELGDVADVQWGDTSVTKASYVSEGYPAYSASGQDGFRKTYDFDRLGIILSAIGANCGITWLARNKWSVIKNTIRFWSTDERVSTEYLFLATMRQESWPQRGSAQPFITMGDARKRKILVPAKNILKQFNDFIVEAYLKIDNARLENQKLAALRDLLLPKLMNGEIKV